MTGVEAIEAERNRQIADLWSAAHDDEHTDGSLAAAGAAYAYPHGLQARSPHRHVHKRLLWPWTNGWQEHPNRIRELAKAGALIAAEIDRLQRLEPA